MPTPIRQRLENVTYHITSRCCETRHLMAQDKIKDIVITVLSRALEKYDFKLIGYTIMDNHVHFIIQTVADGADISRIMQYIKARIAEKYNRLMQRTGPFWNERFKDTIVEQQDNPVIYLLWLLWYLAFNPVHARKCKDPQKYRYSSINYYLTEGIPSLIKITRHQYFDDLGTTFAERMRCFLSYEEAYRKRIVIFHT